MNTRRSFRYLCNAAPQSVLHAGPADKVVELDYLKQGKREPNIRIELPAFVESLFHIPPRILDLLEIACYVYCADRNSYRGSKEALEYHAWAREIELGVRVRDFNFWNSEQVMGKLTEVLNFMSGDSNWAFSFAPGHTTQRHFLQ